MAGNWKTRLVQPAVASSTPFRSLAPPTVRGSTTLFERAADIREQWRPDKGQVSYGLFGTPTTAELAARIAELEGGLHSFITPSGQASVALIYLALTKAGDHVLVPESIYGPNRSLAEQLLSRFGLDAEFYDPMIGDGIGALIRDRTRLIWCESPGSVTMEVQDVPAIARIAHANGALVALDNSYAAGVLFDAFAHGVDVTVQALTKYVGGHSDLLLGTVTVRDESLYEALGNARKLLGLAVSPDDCSLALRGLQTLALRLERFEASALTVARWLAGRDEIETVLHPALETCPGHAIWARDFTGSAGVFSVVFMAEAEAGIGRFLDALRLFKLGYSWGGVTSLAVPYFDARRQARRYGARLVRISVGLEECDDLIADLANALAAMKT